MDDYKLEYLFSSPWVHAFLFAQYCSQHPGPVNDQIKAVMVKTTGMTMEDFDKLPVCIQPDRLALYMWQREDWLRAFEATCRYSPLADGLLLWRRDRGVEPVMLDAILADSAVLFKPHYHTPPVAISDFNALWRVLPDAERKAVILQIHDHPSTLKVPWWNKGRSSDAGMLPHLDVEKHPGLVVFYATPEHLSKGRITSMKPGRYLTKYLPDMTPDTVREYASAVDSPFTLKFAVTADEIELVYLEGPDSCMSKAGSYYHSGVHPVRVYGDSDLQLAYLSKYDGKISARALVWPDKKVVGRIYGDWIRLAAYLKSAGYTSNEDRDYDYLEGAKLTLIEEGNRIVCPYIDGSNEVTLAGGQLYVGDCANKHGGKCIEAVNTDGYANLNSGTYCPRLDEYVDEDHDDFTYVRDADEYWSTAAIEAYAWHDDVDGHYYSVDIEATDAYSRFSLADMRGRGRVTTRADSDDIWYCEMLDCTFTDDVPSVMLYDTNEQVPLGYADANCFFHDGDWYTENPVEDDEDSEDQAKAA